MFLFVILVLVGELFDVCRWYHRRTGCQGKQKQYRSLKYEVRLPGLFSDAFRDTCHFCQAVPQQNIPERVGALCAIRSDHFRSRYLFDLIDMRNRLHDGQPVKNEYGIVMNWLGVLVDHNTTFVMIGAFGGKGQEIIIPWILYAFSLRGPPLIFHTDNEKAVAGKLILDAIKTQHNWVSTITGKFNNSSIHSSVTTTIANKSLTHYPTQV